MGKEVIVEDLTFDTNTIDSMNPYNEFSMRCSTTNNDYIKLAKEFECDDELFVNDFYFGITRNEITKRFKPTTCRLFYINIDGNDITIIPNANATKYQEIVEMIKYYARISC